MNSLFLQNIIGFTLFKVKFYPDHLQMPTVKVITFSQHFKNFELSGKVKDNVYMIRYYNINKRLFPTMFQTFRLALSTQPVVNFPPLTARLLYEKYTDHIEQDEPLNVYDPSSGWGGRILGAMASMKRIHYVAALTLNL